MKSRVCYKDKSALSRAVGRALDAFLEGDVISMRGGKRKNWYWLEVEYNSYGQTK